MSDSEKDSQPRQVVPVDVNRAIRQHLMSLKWAGVTQLPKSVGKYEFPGLVFSQAESNVSIVSEKRTPLAQKLAKTPRESRPIQNVTIDSAAKYELTAPQESKGSLEALYPQADGWSTPLPVAARSEALALLQTEVASCTKCHELANTRTQTVFGIGSANPRLVFFGEAPGADEDRLGEPFVGAAGQLLTKIIEAMKLSRDEVYILNTLKCRPPGNRNPQELELRNCRDFSIRQLEILQPEFICCLGSIAAKTLLDSKLSIGRLRGRFFKWRGSQVLATYHPAYLLRSPEAKKHVWADMKILMAEMGQ